MNRAVTVEVNGETMVFGAGATVAEVVRALGCGTRGVAVAVNREVVRRGDWPDKQLSEGDQLEVLQAVAGG